ncbi:MAG: hypothetical protein JO031_13955, partial [Ktedonobacteraceae bacterium]|nr:hypothetical protein [Ktedonobacteraceae bacterium]
KKCLPYARGEATIVPDAFNDTMLFQVYGLAPNQKYTLFVTQFPNKPFGISWYQGAIETNSYGNGSVIVRGILDAKTFSVSPGGTTTFAPTNQYHLGLWFSDPQTPFKLGCEPGAKAPIVTPFNGAHHAGILALNTSNFPLNAGPLSHVHSTSLNATQAQNRISFQGDKAFSFPVVPAGAAIKKCLPYARGEATIVPDAFNDTMLFQVHGLAPNQKYTLFVTQFPNKPFGISWYQGAIETDRYGDGNVIVRGILDPKTFSVSPGGTTTFAPTNQYHLGLWFSDPQTPFKLGCESGAKAPIVTPFNGAHHAGILALNTGNFPLNAGPLSKIQH